MSLNTQNTADTLPHPPAHILVVDDDERLRSLLSRFLTERGFVVSTATDAAEARDILDHLVYDLIVLDVMMPGEDGVTLTQSLKAQGVDTPVMLLTALGEITDRIAGLTAGADDYLPKPFEPEELLLRIRAILRRTRQSVTVTAPAALATGEGGGLRIGPWQIDTDKGEMVASDARALMTQAELTLFKALASRAGQVVSREDLAVLCGLTANERTIDVQVTRLRKKLGDDPRQPRYIQTVRGKGYVLWAG